MPIFTVNQGTIDEYDRLDIGPGESFTIQLDGVAGDACETDSAGFQISKFRYDGLSLATTSLPLSINPREPGTSSAVKAMRTTLKEAQTSRFFHLYNTGMAIIANSCEIVDVGGSKSARINFNTAEHGICNGGHTYFAIKRAIQEAEVGGNFSVNAEVIVLPDSMSDPDKKKWSILFAKARNFSNPLKEASLADAAGFFETIKDRLGDMKHFIEYHENDSEAHENAIEAKLLLRALASLHPNLHKHSMYAPTKKNHEACVRSDKAKVWNPWRDQNEDHTKTVDLEMMYPLSRDVLILRDVIADLIHNDSDGMGYDSWKMKNIFAEWITGNSTRPPLVQGFGIGVEVAKVPVTLETALIGSLRDMIHITTDGNNRPSLIGWSKDPVAYLKKTVLDQNYNELMKHLIQMANEFTASNDAVHFLTTGAPYKQIVEYNPGAGFTPPDFPEICYRLSDGKKFVQTVDENTATHTISGTGEMIRLSTPVTGKNHYAEA